MAPDTADSSTALGAAIAGHRITGVIERGRSGASFRAVAPDGTPVVLRLRSPREGRATARLRAQAETLSGLSHPALPRVTGFGEAPEGLWVASAEVEGAGLRTLLDERLAPMRAVRLLGEVADGLDAAHRAGLVRAYRSLALAARTGRRTAFRHAVRRVRRADRRVRVTLQAL